MTLKADNFSREGPGHLPVLGYSNVVTTVKRTGFSALVKLFCFPLHWYNLIFLVACAVWITLWQCRRKPNMMLLLCSVTALYNSVVLTALSDAGAGYLMFSWIPVLIVVGWAYDGLGRKAVMTINAFINKNRWNIKNIKA